MYLYMKFYLIIFISFSFSCHIKKYCISDEDNFIVERREKIKGRNILYSIDISEKTLEIIKINVTSNTNKTYGKEYDIIEFEYKVKDEIVFLSVYYKLDERPIRKNLRIKINKLKNTDIKCR